MISERNKEFCNYIDTYEYEEKPEIIDFYLRCKDSGMHYADADRYAILNTLFQYDIGIENAREIDRWMYENDEEIYELSYRDKDLIEIAANELKLNLDFSKFRTDDYETYEYFVA